MWNSIAFFCIVLFEAICMIFLYTRALRSKNGYEKRHLYVLPFLGNLLLCSLLLGLLWMDPDLPSAQGPVGTSCSSYNRNLTQLFWLGPFILQPYCMINACRRVGSSANQGYLRGPETACLWLWFSFFLPHIIYKPLPPHTKYQSLEAVQHYGFTTFNNEWTCTFLGPNQLLYPTFAMRQSWALSNLLSWFFPLIALYFSRPLKFAAGCFMGLGGFFLLALAVYKLSMEAISVYIVGASILAPIYFIFQPHVILYSQGDMILLQPSIKTFHPDDDEVEVI